MLFVIEMCCNLGHIIVNGCFCSPDIKLLCVGICPYSLPRELTFTTAAAVYNRPTWTPKTISNPHLLFSFPFLLTHYQFVQSSLLFCVSLPLFSLSVSVSFCRSPASRRSRCMGFLWQIQCALQHLSMLLPFLWFIPICCTIYLS